MINTLLDAFEMKIRSERALAEHRLQAELTNLRQSLLSVLPQNRSVTNYEINALQEEQQMLRDMVSELQDSLESMSRRFISSRLSVGSLEHKTNPDEVSDDEDDCDDAVVEVSRVSVLKNEIIYPSIRVEKQNHVPESESESEDEESEEEEAPPAPVKKPAASAPVKKPAPAPAPESEDEESEEEAPVPPPVKKTAAAVTPAKKPEPESEEEEEGPDVSVPEEEEEEAELEEFTFKGKTYYKDDDNNVYNDDGDLIGRKVGASVVFNKK